jgi:toxin ParE1/3/4
MKRDLFLTPRAESDLDAHILYLSENADIETALRFEEEAFASFVRLQEMPFLGSEREYLNPSIKNLRLWFVNDFEDYLIFYRVLDDAIQIVRVLYSSRDIQRVISDEPAN